MPISKIIKPYKENSTEVTENANEYFVILQQSIKSTGRIAKMVAARQKRLTRMVTIMIAAFNLAWTPYAFVAILKLLQRNFLPVTWTVPGLLLCKTYVKLVDKMQLLHTYVALLFKNRIIHINFFVSFHRNCFWNPIIYVFLNPSVSSEFTNIECFSYFLFEFAHL